MIKIIIIAILIGLAAGLAGSFGTVASDTFLKFYLVGWAAAYLGMNLITHAI